MKVRLITVSTVPSNGKEVPALRLSGDWLGKLGFRLGRKVIIQEKPGQLMVQLVSIAAEDRPGSEEGSPCEWPL